MIQKEVIREILSRTDLPSLIGEDTTLKKSGSTMVGCCPLHQERTPSFHVYPDGHYHCYGCGRHGNAITYVMEKKNMSFPEAVRYLGAREGITVTEREETEKERTRRLETEELYIVNDAVYRNYFDEFKSCKEAQDYAYNRWGKEYCDKIGLGYAPGGQFLVGKRHHRKPLVTLGLINDNDYDFFYKRLVIPIRDRWQRVIAFTARRMDGEDKCKYINSKDSPIYKKGETLFGADMAFNNTSKGQTVYLVEGAPDCMRLQQLKVYNSFADLGTAWTDSQFSLIKKLTDKVCFIPDGDVPKQGDEFGPGYKAVFKAGRKAMKHGFTVLVKPIAAIDGVKQDPDSYFKDRLMFDQTQEEDFVMWYARCLFDRAYSTTEKSEVVKKVSDLLSYITDKTQLSLYIDELKSYVPGKRMWQQAIETQRQQQELDRNKDEEDTDDMNQKYGFHIENGKYYSVTDKGSVYVWSNFILLPLYLITDPENPQRLFEMINDLGKKILIALDPGDLVSLASFRIKVEQKGNFIWNASERELNKLKRYLFSKTEDAKPIKQLGWQKEEFFAFGNGICIDGEFHPTDDFGIVKIDNVGTFFLPSNASFNRNNNRQYSFEHQFVHLGRSSVTLRDYTDQLFKVYGNNGREGFAFYLATLFKDIVIRKTRSFPLLDLFGPKGSGKSDMAQSLMSFFIIENKGISLTNSTMASLGSAVGAVSNALVHLEEYKNMLDPKRIEFLKGLWDGIGRTRMSLDKSGKKETSAVDSGVIVSGQEMPTTDIALFTRLIFLRFPRSEFSIEEKQEHKKLMAMASTGLTHLTIKILALRDHMERFFPSMYDEAFDIISRELENEPIEDRILKNWVTPLAVYRTLEPLLKVRLSTQELIDITVSGIKTQSRETKSNSELGSFWNVVQYLVGEGELVEDCDFKIQYKRHFKSSVVDVEWQETHSILFIQKSKVFMLYKMKERSAGDNVIPEESLKYYLEQSRAFLGEKNMRYFVSIKGVRQQVTDPKNKDKLIYQVTSQRSYCFDYDILQRVYGIKIDNQNISDIEE